LHRYLADEVLVNELMQHWRDIEDLEDPVVAYTRALAQHLRGDGSNAKDSLRTAALYNDVGRFFLKSARYVGLLQCKCVKQCVKLRPDCCLNHLRCKGCPPEYCHTARLQGLCMC
jgi:hypothetical protein